MSGTPILPSEERGDGTGTVTPFMQPHGSLMLLLSSDSTPIPVQVAFHSLSPTHQGASCLRAFAPPIPSAAQASCGLDSWSKHPMTLPEANFSLNA